MVLAPGACTDVTTRRVSGRSISSWQGLTRMRNFFSRKNVVYYLYTLVLKKKIRHPDEHTGVDPGKLSNAPILYQI